MPVKKKIPAKEKMPVKKKIPAEKKPAAHPAAPKRSKNVYRDIFDTSAIASAVIEKDGTFSLVNHRFEELSGYSKDEVEGTKSWTELVAPGDLEKLNQYTRGLIKPDGQAPPTSFCLKDKNGTLHPMLLSLKVMPGARQAIASITENSVQKKLEQMLRAQEERYRTLVDDCPVGVYQNKLENPGRFLWGNPALVRMYGYDSLAELLKYPVRSVYADPADRDRFIDELATQGMVRNFETVQKKKDGSLFPVRITAHPRKNRNGETEWVEGIVEDLTGERLVRESGGQKQRLANAAFNSAVDVGIFTTDGSGTITLVNRGLVQMLGYTADELIGKQTPLLFHSETELAAWARLISEETGQPVTGFEILSQPVQLAIFDARECTYLTKDQRAIPVILTVASLETEDGEQLGYLFTAKEISERKMREDLFTASNLRMSEIIYNLPDATFAIDHEGRVIAWNRAMENSTGVMAADMIGRGDYEYALPFYGMRRPLLIDLIEEPDEKIREWGYTTIKRKGNAIMAENPTIDPDNTLRILWGLAAPIFNANGTRIGAIQSIADITSRWKRETALENTTRKFREILDNIGTATLIVEEDDTISFINPEFGRILGYVRDEIEGKKKWMEFVVPEDVRHLQKFAKKYALEADGPANIDVRFIRWDGEVRNALLTITRIPKTEKLVVAILDITDKIRAETAVQLANRKLNFLNSIIRHDILNQLTVLKGNLDLALQTNIDKRQGVVLEKEMAATEAIQSLITFTREYQDIGNEPPEWQDVKRSVLAARAGIRPGKITISLEIEGVEIYADRLLSNVFLHLMQNAINHGKKTTRIRLFCEESFEELHIVCDDDGIGVPPELKEKIFNRQFFNRTGLEMYLTQEILSITGIGIRETGIYGQGACFELRVPKGRYRFTAQQ